MYHEYQIAYNLLLQCVHKYYAYTAIVAIAMPHNLINLATKEAISYLQITASLLNQTCCSRWRLSIGDYKRLDTNNLQSISATLRKV